jgi:hypothetical protein
LCPVEVSVLVGNSDGVRARKNWLDMVLALSHPAKDVVFRFDRLGGGELTAGNTLGPVDNLKLPGCQAGVKIGADLDMGNLAHSATKPVADQCTFIYNRLALEVLVTREG